VGELRVGARDEGAVVVGLPAASVPPALRVVEGRLFAERAAGEVVLGSEIAARLGVRPGDVLPPIGRNESGERTLRVVGVFRSDAPLWQAHAILASLETAGSLFAEGTAATEFLVRCPPGYREPVAAAIRSLESLGPPGALPPIRPRATTRDDVEALLLRRALDRETLFQLPLLLAFALGAPLVLVASGVGLVERRREAGILRAVGWSQDALLLRALVESLLLALLGAAAAVLLACAWLRLLDGAGIAPVLLPGADRIPAFRVPWRLAPETALTALAVSVAMVSAGTLFSTWRYATTPPAEAMR
jgi:ABC-type lipoprotein release transport system permease subunit